MTQDPMNAAVPEVVASELEQQGVMRGSYAFTPHDGLRRLIAKRMVESVQTAPHFSVDMKIEVDALLALRQKRNASGGIKVSVNDCLIKAAGLALIRSPGVNLAFTSKGTIHHHHADVAFAVAIDGGLITPIIRTVETKSLSDIAAETVDLAARAKIKKLKPEEYYGGSFSISNLGMFGVSRFEAVINQPQGAILSIGGTEASYLPRTGMAQPVQAMTVTLTSDHRAIDGATAARWLQQLKAIIESPDEWAAA